jgi:lysophospholipase L1-like esterase
MASTERMVQVKQGQTLLFEGDSMTSRLAPPAHDNWPFLRLMHWHRSYADIMQEWLFCNRPELDLKFRNSAVGGSSAGQILARFDAVVPVVRPDWIIMTTAHNDAAREIPLPQFREELTTYATRARDLCGARLFIVGGFAPCPGSPADHVERWPRLGGYYGVAREVAEAQQGAWLDLSEPLLAKTQALHRQCELHTIYSDGVHYNEVGNQIVAFLILEAMGLLSLH